MSQWTPLADMYASQRTLRLADGPDEVHWFVVGRSELARWEEEGGNTYDPKVEYLSRPIRSRTASSPVRDLEEGAAVAGGAHGEQRVEEIEDPPVDGDGQQAGRGRCRARRHRPCNESTTS